MLGIELLSSLTFFVLDYYINREHLYKEDYMELERIKEFIIKAVGKKGTPIEDICKKLDIKDYELLGAIELLKQDGALLDVFDGKVYKLQKPKQIEEIYGVQIKLADDKVKGIVLTGMMPNDNLDVLLEAISISQNCTINKVGDSITITSK